MEKEEFSVFVTHVDNMICREVGRKEIREHRVEIEKITRKNNYGEGRLTNRHITNRVAVDFDPLIQEKCFVIVAFLTIKEQDYLEETGLPDVVCVVADEGTASKIVEEINKTKYKNKLPKNGELQEVKSIEVELTEI